MTDVSMWMALESAMQQDGKQRRSVSRETVRRVAAFARPHLRTIIAFLVLATGSAVLGVATPVLAGRAVNAIVEQHATATVVGLAVLDRRSSPSSTRSSDSSNGSSRHDSARDSSSTCAAGCSSTCRACRSRSSPAPTPARWSAGLNNDVIGAQRAFTSALSGVVTNVIALVLTVVVMLSLSWQITVLALVLLPVFVIPARRVGAKVGALEREATEHNAAMTSQMTERFSAPGATLVKLFGRPGPRGGRVRPSGRSASTTSESDRRWRWRCSSGR